MSLQRLPPPQSPRPQERSAWQVQRSVLFALLQREMKARVGGQWIGAVWTLFEPLAHVLVMLSLYTVFLHRQAPLASIEYAVFLVTGLLPYFLFQNLATRLMDGIESNRGLFSYRQVKPLDTLVSRTLVEALMNLAVYLFTLMLLGWLGFHVVPTGPLELLGAQAVMLCLGCGFGILFAVWSYRRPKVRTFVRMVMMPLYLISGVIFPIDLAPPEALQWLTLNPLLHLLELSRHAFIPAYVPLPEVNWTYPLMFALVTLTLALLAYRADRLRLVTA